MTINIRQKGQEGEREIARMLNGIVQSVRVTAGYEPLAIEDLPFQRNQNQSAVGGDDLSNPFGLSIEVKRQEQLSINSWWKQCIQSSLKTNGFAILIFRQNRKQWRVMLSTPIPFAKDAYIGPVRVEIDIDTFRSWFGHFYERWLSDNELR